VSAALANNNFLSAVGSTKGQMVQVNLSASTEMTSLEAFRNLAAKQKGGAIVRLQDVAHVTLGAVSRFNMGLVIATGIAIGTVFTLFVVPAMYMLVAEDHGQRRAAEGVSESLPSEGAAG